MYKNDIPEHFAVYSNAVSKTKIISDTPNGMGQSLEQLHKECCVLQDMLCAFRERVSPLLKEQPCQEKDRPDCYDDNVRIAGVSARTHFIISIGSRVRDMQRFVELLTLDIDL